MLRVKSLSKSFDGFMAVNRADLEVEKGEIVAVIGPNGAGKTTLFNLLTGLLKPDGGKVFLKDQDITGLPAHEICREGISRSFQVVNVFQRLSVFENVQISVLSRKKKTWDFITPATKYLKDRDFILPIMQKRIHQENLLKKRKKSPRKAVKKNAKPVCSPMATAKCWR